LGGAPLRRSRDRLIEQEKEKEKEWVDKRREERSAMESGLGHPGGDEWG